MTPTPANPENVPTDKIPAGWRLLYEHEYRCAPFVLPCRVWSDPKNKGKFSSDIDLRPSYAEYTYITPDLPDNGQPWHAHKPGDPAPVEDGVNVDFVCRGGKIYTRQISADWSALPRAPDSDILFYRLHDPAPKQPSTFEAHGHTWFRHTPGDPCPCNRDARVSAIYAEEVGGIYHHGTDEARKWHWGLTKAPNRIVGWRYATPEQPAKPHDPSISDRILDLLIVAGHVTAERVEQARKLAQL